MCRADSTVKTDAALQEMIGAVNASGIGFYAYNGFGLSTVPQSNCTYPSGWGQ